MSAQEIIEQIKALPPEERAAVLEFTRNLDVAEPGVRYVDPKTLERVADKVFAEHDELFRKLAQ